jgi:hypothetical protein
MFERRMKQHLLNTCSELLIYIGVRHLVISPNEQCLAWRSAAQRYNGFDELDWNVGMHAARCGLACHLLRMTPRAYHQSFHAYDSLRVRLVHCGREYWTPAALAASYQTDQIKIRLVPPPQIHLHWCARVPVWLVPRSPVMRLSTTT